MDQVAKLKARYAAAIEDGRKVEVFTSMPEYRWYIDNVINPTVEEYTNRILNGTIQSNKEDWMVRGMIAGIKLVVETTDGFMRTGEEAKKKAKDYQKFLETEDFDGPR